MMIFIQCIIIRFLRIRQVLLGFTLILDGFRILCCSRFLNSFLFQRLNIRINTLIDLFQGLLHALIILDKSICCQAVAGSHGFIQLVQDIVGCILTALFYLSC